MLNNKEKGNLGEEIACSYIESLGYKILSNNYRTKRGEIDIIAYYNNILIFIEVKLRKSLKYGTPIEAIDFKKANTIRLVAQEYIRIKNLYDYPVRFDVVEVFLYDNSFKVNIVENAF